MSAISEKNSEAQSGKDESSKTSVRSTSSRGEEMNEEVSFMPEDLGEEGSEEELEIDINKFFEHIGLDKSLKFTEKTMQEFEDDMDFENNTPKDRLVFVPAKRFSNFNYHFLLETYVPYTVDLSCMSLLSLDGIEFLFFVSYVNASNNLLTSDGLQFIEYLDDLIALIAYKNNMKTLKIPTLDQLMFVDVSENNITLIEPSFYLPGLETLIANDNRLQDIVLLGRNNLPKLSFLSVANNYLTDLNVQWSRHLTVLYLGGNEIADMSGLAGLYKLRRLHLRSNIISSLADFPEDLVSLDYLNLRSNQINDIHTLENLRKAPHLKTLIIKGNPCTFLGESEDNYRLIALSYLLTLKRLDKTKVSEEELHKATLMMRSFQGEGEEETLGGSSRTEEN